MNLVHAIRSLFSYPSFNGDIETWAKTEYRNDSTFAVYSFKKQFKNII